MKFTTFFIILSIAISCGLGTLVTLLSHGLIGIGRELLLERNERARLEDTQRAIKKALLISYPKTVVKDRSGKKERDILIGVTDFEAEVYAFIFTTLAEKYGVDWEALAALIWVESRFNPTLTSSSDAKGLAQLLEPTAKETAKREGIPYVENHVVWNDLNSLELGVSYFCRGVVLGDTVDYEKMYKGYVGGDNYARLKKPDNVQYVKYYYSLSTRECQKIHYIFKGLLNP